jgi:AraC-like DNA-binding protein
MEEITVLPDQSEILHYENPAFPLYIIEASLSQYSEKRVLCHWHKEMEFFLVEEGHPAYFVNGNVVQLQEGDGIFVNSKTLHYGFSPDGSDSRYLCLVFMPTLFEPNSYIQSGFVDPLNEEEDLPYLRIPKECCDTLRKELLAIQDLFKEKKPNYPLFLLSHLYSFWGEFLSLRGENKQSLILANSKTALIKRMLSFLYQNYQEKIRIEEIAASAAISPSYAIHLFSDYLHSSPIVYLNAYRIEKACDLLKESSQNISEIASAVGFDSPSYFSEIFHRYKGCSPREYQKAVQPSES